MHTEVWWVSKGNCLERFLAVFNLVIVFFFSSKDRVFEDNLAERKIDIVYMSDSYGEFNHLNKT